MTTILESIYEVRETLRKISYLCVVLAALTLVFVVGLEPGSAGQVVAVVDLVGLLILALLLEVLVYFSSEEDKYE